MESNIKTSSGIFFLVLLVAFWQSALCIPVEAPCGNGMSKVAEMRSYMKSDVNPCVDFYEYSCGKWSKVHPAGPKDNTTTGFPQIMNTQHEKVLSRMLNGGRKPEDTEIDTKVKDFYQSCINFAKNFTLADFVVLILDIRRIISEFGEMPAISGDTWKANEFDWLETVAQIAHKYGKGIITKLLPVRDFFNNTVGAIYVGPQNFPLGDRSMYISKEGEARRQQYKNSTANNLRIYLAINEDIANTTATELVNFEVALARGMIDEKSYNRTLDFKAKTVAALTKKYAPTLNIEKLINITMGKSFAGSIYEYDDSYLKNVVDVIQRTPKRIVANYIMYSLLGEFWVGIPDSSAGRESLCLAKTKKYFARNLDNMVHRHYRTYNATGTLRDIMIMWDELKKAFAAELKSGELDWISPETRQKAREKLHAVKLEVSTYENVNFAEEFGDLQISENAFIGNLKNILEWDSRRMRAALNNSVTYVEPGEYITQTSTPTYVSFENRINVPEMLLQPGTQWQHSYPNALKFGTLGTILAHELLHGFDDIGRQLEKNGNIANWWDAESAAAFNKRKECFIDQYSRYSYGGKPLPRNMLQMENIADNGALRLAYAAYLRWLQKASESGKEVKGETLPTMNLTSKQLYFLGFAQLYCSDADPSMYASKRADVHAPESIRVIAPVSNFPEFSRQFGCSSETPMNATQKCKIY